MTNFQYFYDNVTALGRHVNHDERSKLFAFDASGVTPKSVRHSRHIPVLDQGNLGSCTGNAMTGLLGSGDFFAPLPAGSLDPVNATFDETVAVSLYSLATQLDGYKGTYPPNDTGSDGLSVAKAAQKKGWITGYQHTFSFNSFLSALTLQPVIVGIDWYSSFETPDANGLVWIGNTASVEGGHEIVADELDVAGRRIGFTNSWGVNWGQDGRFYIGFDDFQTLLANHGDVTVPVALPAVVPTPVPPVPTPTPTPVPPVPTPTPVPTPDPADVALWADMQKWAKLKGLS
jgi:hypothetical protein